MNQSMSSAADSPARIFPTPDEGQGLTGSGLGCSLRPFAWFANCNPDALCWKTWQRCLVEDWTEFSGRWPRSGMMRNGIAYRLPPLVPRISGTGYLSWDITRKWIPTARAQARVKCFDRGRDYHGNLEEWVGRDTAGKLNPMWVEWLMGFPLGWTDCEDSETQ